MKSLLSPWSKRSAAIGSILLFLVLFFVACSDDDSGFSTRPTHGPFSSESSSSRSGLDPESSSKGDGGSETAKTSSSAKSSSSSSELSSSSIIGCRTETEDNCEYGELEDPRDGRTYRTVKIGDVWWMAENLNFDTILGRCYNDSAEYCEKYGRLYIHSERICPEGWFLPSLGDWYALFEAAGGRTKEDGFSVVTTALRSTSGWRCDDTDCTAGTDAFGFSALPAGYYDEIKNDKFLNEGYMTKFWTSTGEYANYKVGVTLYDLTQSDYPNYYDITWEIASGDMLSIRCIHY